MAEGIPPDFDRVWSHSDVVLRTANSGNDLYANKAALAFFSPYFNGLFSGRFVDAKNYLREQNVCMMQCDYSAMKEVLRYIHRINCGNNGQNPYGFKMVKELYDIGDRYDFPHIRRLCHDQMMERPSAEMAVLASLPGRRNIMMEILKRLPKDEIRRFLGFPVKHLFSKNEFLSLFEIVVGRPLPRRPVSIDSLFTRPLNLEEITVPIPNPRIDLMKPRELSDVAIATKNSHGRLLFSKISFLELECSKFELLRRSGIQFERRLLQMATVDAEYTTMRELLGVLHQCYRIGLPRLLPPALLHSMYRVASGEELDIPTIRDFCLLQLGAQPGLDSWDVCARLNVFPKRDFPVTPELLYEWIFREGGLLSYRKGDEVVAVTPFPDEPFLDQRKVWDLIDVLSRYEP